MSPGLVLLIFLSVAAASDYQLFNSDGWVPVTGDVTLSQIRRETNHQESLRQIKSDNFGIESDVLVAPYYQNHEKTMIGDGADVKCRRDSLSCFNEVNNELYEEQPKHDFSPDVLHYANNYSNVKSMRKSKNIADNTSHIFLNSFIPINESANEDKRNIFTKSKKSNQVAHTYEVTEDIAAEDSNQEETDLKTVKHDFSRRKQNFTNGFIKYLSKYNIRNDDNLQNYALSRRKKAVYPGKPNREDKTIHFRVPIRSNSLNHLSVDPLLAVFLSNYGYYLQGQYGIQNNYNNLYGYLASNNMHNNIPFGAYKLVSDTDSSH